MVFGVLDKDCGWVDPRFRGDKLALHGTPYGAADAGVQWSGPSPAQDTSDWQEITYKHDVLGRRIEKKVDGYSTRYVYDGPHVIAEYDGNNNLLRKYIFGPGIDQPVSMIEVADANATYYYHYDALGSVVALSDAAGDTVQTYEYSVYGEVAVEDANHPNPYMFAGVRYDIEIGLYYNRARYYNPFTGRFLQTDPIGYADGMNMYAYCGNNPLVFVDPSGRFGTFVGITIWLEGILNDLNDMNDSEWEELCYRLEHADSNTITLILGDRNLEDPSAEPWFTMPTPSEVLEALREAAKYAAPANPAGVGEGALGLAVVEYNRRVKNNYIQDNWPEISDGLSVSPGSKIVNRLIVWWDFIVNGYIPPPKIEDDDT